MSGPKAPFRLGCEFLTDPLGVTAHPNFSWWVDDPRPAEVQSAYEIQAASSAERLTGEAADLWLSGRIEGCENAHIPYQGLPVGSGQAVSWRVRTYDSDGVASPWSEVATFEMGLLNGASAGEWISSGLRGNRHTAAAATLLRCDFELNELPLTARLTVGLKGQAKVFVNSQPCADLAPVWMDLSRWHPRFTLDVTSYLRAGTNQLVFLLADGIYCGRIPGLGRELFGTSPQLQALLQCEGESGRKVELLTGSDWYWRPAWVAMSEWVLGDSIDLRQREPQLIQQSSLSEWGLVSLHPHDGSQPRNVMVESQALTPLESSGSPTRRLINSAGGPKRIIAQVPFPQAVLGDVELIVTGKAVDEIEVRYFLDGSGPHSVDRYTTRGEGSQEVLTPEFACHHFTSVEIEYSVRTTLVETVQARDRSQRQPAIALHSDHATLNKLIEATHHTEAMVARSAPLRGVTPAQRIPDLGYASTWFEMLTVDPANYVMLSKWLRDAQASAADGLGPYDTGRQASGVDSDEFARFESMVQLTWYLYRYQNASQLLADLYPQLRATALSFRHAEPELLRHPRPDLYGAGDGGSLVATARLYRHVVLLARMAEVLNQHGDSEMLDTLATQIRTAFRQRFVTGDGHVVTDTPSALLAVLHWGLLEELEVERVRARLLEQVRSSKYQLQVAPAVVAALLPELSRAGRLDMAYMVLLQTTPTSWMGQMLAGRKLVYADDQPDASQLGVWRWLLTEVVGISLPNALDSEENGFRHLRLAPKPPLGAQFQAGAPFNQITASLATLYGVIEVSWRIGERAFEMELKLPPSCSAEVELPDGVTQRVQSGTHNFAMEYARGGDGVPILREVDS